MKQWHKKLQEMKLRHRIIVGFFLVLAVLLLVSVLSHPRVSIKAYYDKDAKELVIAPGFLYTLESYSFGYSGNRVYPAVEEILIPLSEQTDQEYRFQGACGDRRAGIDIFVSYRNSLSGELYRTIIHAERQRFDNVNSFDIVDFNNGIFVRFSVYPPKT